MKKILLSILTLAILLSLCACGKPASSPVEDFEYELKDGKAIITAYKGTDLEIVIPDTIEERPVTTIDDHAFAGYDMTSVIIPEGVTSIGIKAFYNCECLENISLPKTIKTIYGDTFSCTKWRDNQEDGALYLDSILLGYKNSFSGELNIKDGTTYIANSAFKGSDVTSVTIPNSVVTIGGCAFLDCKNLTSVTIPESVQMVGDNSFGKEFLHNYNNGFTTFDTYFKTINEFTIHGKAGTSAEEYANKNDIRFIAE